MNTRLSDVIHVINVFEHESEQLRQKEQQRLSQMRPSVIQPEINIPENSQIEEIPSKISIIQAANQSLSQPLEKGKKESSLFDKSNRSFSENSRDVINFSKLSEDGPEPSSLKNIQLAKAIQCVLMDRKRLQEKVDNSSKSIHEMRYWLKNMQTQILMMLALLRDLMNQAQLANNTFTMVDGFFDLNKTVKKCIKSMESHSHAKNVRLLGP